MIKILLVCDDSTGANASGILLNQLGLKTLSIINHKHAKFNEAYDAMSVSTDSRAITSQQAYDRVRSVLERFKDCKIDLLNKRVDSTLRGNIGSELNAFFDMYPQKKIAIVPSYPSSNRTCVDGRVYVSGISLEKTDVAKDPKMPIFTANAKELFKKQFKGKIDNIYLSSYNNQDLLYKKITDGYKLNDALIFDAKDNHDIDMISKALVALEIDVITVDPGYFTFLYAKEYIQNIAKSNRKYIYMVGSVTDTTFNQLKFIEHHQDFLIIPIDPLCLVEHTNLEQLEKDIIKKVNNTSKRHIFITTANPENRLILDLNQIAKKLGIDVDQTSKIINSSFARILSKVIKETPNIHGIFGSGGDTSLSFLENNNAHGIELKKEVMPLCVYGKIVGGKFDHLSIITKGGMIGDEDAYILVKNFFEEEVTYE